MSYNKEVPRATFNDFNAIMQTEIEIKLVKQINFIQDDQTDKFRAIRIIFGSSLEK